MTYEPKRKTPDETPLEDEEIKEQIRIGLEIMKEHAETFRALAKASPKDEKSE
jgi:hypothetical protein